MNGASVELSKPITVGDDEIKVLDLREPTVNDITELGYPFLIKDGGVAIQASVIMAYIVRLSANPPSALKTISVSDFGKLQTAIMGFFGDEAA